MTATTSEEQETLARNGSNFASWYRHLIQEVPDRLHTLWTGLEPVIPGLGSLKLPHPGGSSGVRDLVAGMSIGGSTYTVDFDELSDGQRVLVVLYTLLAGFEPENGGCLLLDEPEAHVALSEVQPWLVELDERFQDRGQVFVISHHPEVLDYMAASAPFLFERPSGGPVRVRVSPFDRSEGISASRQLARGLVDAD